MSTRFVNIPSLGGQLMDIEFGERLVTMPNGAQGIRSGVSVTAESPGGAMGEDLAVIDFRSSDETLDRYDEVISAKGWKLDNYRKNPVVQNAHQYGDVMYTIGKAIITEVRDSHLFQRVQFAVDANPVAKITYDLYKGKFLNAVSVGFIPMAWENGEKGKDNYRRRYTEQELLEVSAVGIPANPNALELAIKAGAVEKSDLRELASFLKHFCNDQAGAGSDPRARGSGSDGAQSMQIEQLINQLRKHVQNL